VGCYVAQACHEIGLRIPEDIGIVVRDAVSLVVDNSPVPLSTVEYDYHEIGHEAARMLDALMSGEQAEPGEKLMPPRGLVGRESSVTSG
jgi:LacI family transcriptional regulator